MPAPLASASSAVLALYVLGFFSALTLVALAIGFGIERAFGRTRKIFAVPFAKRQLGFELMGNGTLHRVMHMRHLLFVHRCHHRSRVMTPLSGQSMSVGTLFSNPIVYHALHHARWGVNFGFQAAWMDRLFGTESEEWPGGYERVTAGRPLTRLEERVAP